jgi:hypothetical protein
MPLFTPYCINSLGSGMHPMNGVIYETTGDWVRSPADCEGTDRDPIALAKPWGGICPYRSPADQ